MRGDKKYITVGINLPYYRGKPILIIHPAQVKFFEKSGLVEGVDFSVNRTLPQLEKAIVGQMQKNSKLLAGMKWKDDARRKMWGTAAKLLSAIERARRKKSNAKVSR